VRSEFERHRLGKADDAELGGHVVGQVRDPALLAGHRGDVHDRAPDAAVDHDPRGGLPAEEHALQVHRQGLPQVSRADVEKSPHLRDAGVGYPDAEPVVFVRYLPGDRRRGVRVGHVQPQCLAAVAGRGLLRGGQIAVGRDDRKAPPGQLGRDSPADAGARPGDDGDGRNIGAHCVSQFLARRCEMLVSAVAVSR
jgi:hypothetical protein